MKTKQPNLAALSKRYAKGRLSAERNGAARQIIDECIRDMCPPSFIQARELGFCTEWREMSSIICMNLEFVATDTEGCVSLDV